ncbi:MAG TPA: hypothetical protein VGK33_21275 [Chloroflexota bacterium]
MARLSDRLAVRRGDLAAPLCLAILSLAEPAATQPVAPQAQPAAADSAPVPRDVPGNAPTDSIGALIVQIEPRPEPDLFGFSTLRLGQTIYDDIWSDAAAQPWPARDPELDAFVAGIRNLPIRERVQQANAWINARVRFGDGDLADHHWAGLAQALARGKGVRADIAIAKMQLLAAAGVPRDDLYLVLASDLQRLRPDALLVVRDEDRVYVLASWQDAFVDERQPGLYVPIVALGYEDKWIFGHRLAGQVTVATAPLDVGQASYQALRPSAPSPPR